MNRHHSGKTPEPGYGTPAWPELNFTLDHMDSILLSLLSLLAGFYGLVKSSDRFVEGAANTALLLGVAPLVIGLTIVAFGTSAPEVFTSITASFSGSPGIAIGNVIGSNIANIGLILGITTLACNVDIPGRILRFEIPFLLAITAGFVLLLWDGNLGPVDGLLMLVMLGVFSWAMYRSNPTGEAGEHGEDALKPGEESLKSALLQMTAALVIMVISARILVWGASNIALALGVSELVIGLTIIAMGTSLPELATSLASARKGHHELAIGNVVGSNILNLLVVLPVPALLKGIPAGPEIISRDYPVMLLFTLLAAGVFYWQKKRGGAIGRKTGAVFIIFYLAYTGVLVFFSTQP
jgi:cation:H+ antiporter